MTVSVAATRPPVQDSAVAISTPRSRQASSNAAAWAIMRASILSVSVMASRSWQPHCGRRHGGNPFAAAEEAQPFIGGGLDADLGERESQDLAELPAHG